MAKQSAGAPCHAGGVYAGLSRPGRDGAGACGAFEFSSIPSFHPSCLALQPTVCTVHTLSPSKQTAYKY